MQEIHLPIIGYHRSPLPQKFGTPRQPNLVELASYIDFVSPFDTPAAFEGIEIYSHLWVLWQFHQNVVQKNFRPQVRPPRFGGNAKMGVFATRSMYRPSGLGLSVVRLVGVECHQHSVRLHIAGADMIDGTPIVDIKPYLPFVDSVSNAVSGKIDTPAVRKVVIDAQASQAFADCVLQGVLSATDVDIITQLIAQDPRPAYRQQEVAVVFSLRFLQVDVDFLMDDDGLMHIVQVRILAS